MTALLRIQLLGEFKVYRNGVLVPNGEWHTRQARQLLKILLTEPNRPISSERLVELLWPETDETAGMSLRSAINALRAVLEPDRLRQAPSRYIPRGNNGYKFILPDDGSVWIDVLAFEKALEAALSKEGRPEFEEQLAEALKLYTGDYLSEDEAESWAWGERERLRERYLQGMLRLAELQYNHHRLNEALATCRKALAVGLLSEPLYRLIMRCQAELGDRAGALLTFERCRQLLDEQLGVDPSPQTLQLHSAILQGEFPLSAPASQPVEPSRQAVPSLPTIPKTATSTGATASNIMVGRKLELARMLQQFSQVKEGQTRTIALVGEAGIGKSTLTRFFVERLQTTGAKVLDVTCQQIEEKVTFAPVTTMLTNWLHQTSPVELARLPRPVLAQLATLMPGMYGYLPDLPTFPFINAEHAYSTLIAALVEFFVNLSREQPLVLIWDDVQWADDSTLLLVNRLANLQSVTILLVIILRAEDLGENAALNNTIRTLQRSNRLVTMNLARFTGEEVAEYVRLHRFKNTVPAEQLQQIVQGNALYLTEAVRILEDHSELSEEELTTRIISQSRQIQDVVLARLSHLPQLALSLLEIASVIGRPFTLDLLNPEFYEAEQQALDLLLSRHFLIEANRTDDPEIQLAFAHSLTAQIIYQNCSPLKRRRLHQQVAENMARRYSTRPGRHAAEIADHYRKAGSTNYFNLLRYEIEAGDYARQTVSFRQALLHYARAGELLEAKLAGVLSKELEEWKGRLYLGYALSYEALLDWPGVQENYRKLWSWAEGQGDVRLVGSSAVHLVFTRSLMGYLTEAVEIARAFVAQFERMMVRESGDPQRSLELILNVIRHWMNLLMPEEQSATEDANLNQGWSTFKVVELEVESLEILRLFGSTQAAFLLVEYGRVLLLYGRLEQAEACLKAGIKVSEETNQIISWVIGAMHLSRLYRARGKMAEADHWYQQILNRTANLPEAAWILTWPRLNQAYNFIYGGQLDQAERLLQQLEEELRNNPHFSTHRYSVQIGWGILEQAKGNFERSVQLLKEALKHTPFLYLEAYILAELALAQIAMQQGQLEIALNKLRHLLFFCGERGLLEFYCQVGLVAGGILLATGQDAAAFAVVERVQAYLEKTDYQQLKASSSSLYQLLQITART
jgi:DNA-binding SARP family transcriptional activator/ABC-type dipeptide/oligopeptide/nickel transport system ATPase component